MPRIRTYTSQTSARSARTTSNVGGRRATAADFGGNVGQALANAGQGVQRVAAGLQVLQETRKAEDVAARVATSDFTSRELEIRNEVGPDGAGYHDRVMEEYEDFIASEAEGIEDDEARQEYIRRMRLQTRSVSSRAAQHEFSVAAISSKTKANDALTSLDNKVRLDPDNFDLYMEQGREVIMARPGLSATAKEQMVVNWESDSALARFEGMMDAVTEVDHEH